MVNCNEINKFSSSLNRNIRDVPDRTRPDTSIRLTKKQHKMLEMHLSEYNRQHGTNYGLRRHFYWLNKYCIERLNTNAIIEAHDLQIASPEMYENMSNEEFFLSMNSTIIPPELEPGNKTEVIHFPPLDDEDMHIVNCIKDLLGFKYVADVFRLFIIWTFSGSRYFEVYRLDGKFSMEYYVKKLKVYEKVDDD